MSSPLVPRLQIFAAALLFSTGGVAIKSTALSSWQVASFRSLIAAAAMLVLVPAARRRWNLATVLVGLSYAATLTLFVLANKTTTAANTIFLQSTAPLYILLLAPLFLRERSRARDLVVMAGMAIGLVLLLFGGTRTFATAPNPALGNILGVVAGVTWAATLMGMRWLERREGEGQAPVAVVAGNVLAGAIGLPLALQASTDLQATASWSDLGWILYLGVIQVAVGYVLLTRALGQVSALDASLLLLVEPIFNPLWTFWVHGETPGPAAVGGGFLILVVTFLKSLWDTRRPLPVEENPP